MTLVQRLAEQVLSSQTDLERRAIEAEVRRLLPVEAPLADQSVAVRVADALTGLGPLEPLLEDRDVTDVLVNGPSDIWVERNGELKPAGVSFPDEAAVVAAVERVIAPLGLRLDRASPAVEARLADGSRLHAVVPPISVDGPVVAIRRFLPSMRDLDALEHSRSIDHPGAQLLRQAVAQRRNLIISGATGTGKTTLLNVLSAEIPSAERVVSIEEACELDLHGHVVRLETRPANSEGEGRINMRQLVRQALRLRPDRIIVGEVRGAEALDLIGAINTGHRGSMGTVHANGPSQAMLRIEMLATSGPETVSVASIRRQLWSAVDLIIHLERTGPRRYVESVSEVVGSKLERRWP